MTRSSGALKLALALGVGIGSVLLFFAHAIPQLSWAPSWFPIALRAVGLLVGAASLASLLWHCRPPDAITPQPKPTRLESQETQIIADEEPVVPPRKNARKQARWRALAKWMAILIVYLFVANSVLFGAVGIFGGSSINNMLSLYYTFVLIGPAIIVIAGAVSVARAGLPGRF